MPAELFLVVTTVTSVVIQCISSNYNFPSLSPSSPSLHHAGLVPPLARIPYALLSTVAGLSQALPTSSQGE